MIAQINKKTRKAEYFGIRKLTPRECFRLMGVADEDFDKLLAEENGKRVIANSNLYKLAGNSIVVDCLSAIFRNVFLSEDTPHYTRGQQLELF